MRKLAIFCLCLFFPLSAQAQDLNEVIISEPPALFILEFNDGTEERLLRFKVEIAQSEEDEQTGFELDIKFRDGILEAEVEVEQEDGETETDGSLEGFFTVVAASDFGLQALTRLAELLINAPEDNPVVLILSESLAFTPILPTKCSDAADPEEKQKTCAGECAGCTSCKACCRLRKIRRIFPDGPGDDSAGVAQKLVALSEFSACTGLCTVDRC